MSLKKEFDIDLRGVDGRILHDDRLDTLDALLEQKLGDGVQVCSAVRLRSKKNVVLLLETLSGSESTPKHIIAKLFVVDSYGTEKRVLEDSLRAGLSVPRTIAADAGVILMEYIRGDTLVDAINTSFDQDLVSELAAWYYRFHAANGVIKGDPRLRNFIVGEQGICGLDFEECRLDSWLVDIGGSAASILDTRPVFDVRKRRLVWYLLEEYLKSHGMTRSDDIDRIFVQIVADTIEDTARWRDDDPELLELTSDIRRQGIPVD